MATPNQNGDAILVHKLRSRIKQMQSVMSGPLLFFSGFMACGLDQRVFPAATRLTVYCWLLIHTQSVGPGNWAGNLCSMFCAQTLIARDAVVRSERRSKVTKTYV